MIQRFKTFSDRIDYTGGYTSGFDYLRLMLAVLVLFGHSFLISGDNVSDKVMPFGINQLRGYGVLAVFFSLSGFLVASSLIRTNSIILFLGLRGLRILPALFVEIMLSALLLGPLFTNLSFQEYVSNTELYQYFLNIFGYIHYHLPGVFLENPSARTVNGSLWTVPYEAECYISLAILALIGITKRPAIFLSLFLFLTISLCIFSSLNNVQDFTRGTATGRQLVLFFLSGVLLYLLRAYIPWSGWLALIAVTISAFLVVSQTLIYLAPLPVAYATAYIGLLQPRKLPIIFSGDYSYGIYLYAYPIQQAVFQLVPASTKWYVNFLVALVVVSFFASFSWHFIEKPVLRLKRLLAQKGEKLSQHSNDLISPDKTIAEVAEAEGPIAVPR